MSDLTTIFLYRQWLGTTPNTGADAKIASAIANASTAIEKYLDRTIGIATYVKWLDGCGTPQILVPQWPINNLFGVATTASDVMAVTNTTASFATCSVTATGLVLKWYDTSGDLQSDSTCLWATYKTVTTLAAAVNALGSGWSATIATGCGSYPTAFIKPDVQGPCHDSDTVDLYVPDTWAEARVGAESDRIIEYIDSYVFPVGRSNIMVWWSAGYTLPADNSGHSAISTAGNVPGDLTAVCNAITKAVLDQASVSLGGIQSESIGNYSYSLSTAGAAAISAAILQHRDTLQPYRKVA